MERHGIKGVIRAAPGMGVTAAGMAVVVVMMPTGTGVLLMGLRIRRLRFFGEAQNFRSGQELPWLCQNLSGWVQLLHQLHSLRNSPGKQLGPVEQDGASASHLVLKKRPEILQVAGAPLYVHYRNFLCNAGRGCETPVPAGPFHIREFADSGRFDQHHIGAIGFQQRGQRRRKIPCEGAADTPGVQLPDLITALPQKRGIHAEVSKVVLDQGDFFAFKCFRQQLLDQGGLARSQKAGNQIHISHHVLL